MSEHRMDCDWHFDQYPWECTCGVTYRQQRDRIEAQAAEIKRLKNILRDCDPESMSWLDARDAALGETQ